MLNFLFWNNKWKDFDINIAEFPNFEISVFL